MPGKVKKISNSLTVIFSYLDPGTMRSSVADFQPAFVYETMHPGALPQALLLQPFRLFYYFIETWFSLYDKSL